MSKSPETRDSSPTSPRSVGFLLLKLSTAEGYGLVRALVTNATGLMYLQITNTAWQREKAAEMASAAFVKSMAPHGGQSSQLVFDANDGNAQFLSNLAGAVVGHLKPELSRAAKRRHFEWIVRRLVRK